MFNLTIRDFNGEPRMHDLDIAEALGFGRARDFRKLITRNLTALAGFGDITRATASRVNKHNPAAEEYWLNEHQAFYLCTQSKTAKAFEVTREIINLFVEWRGGRLLPAITAPKFVVTPDTATHLALVQEVRITKGIGAARAIYDQLDLPPIMADVDAGYRAQEGADLGALTSFLQDECVVTGSQADWMYARHFNDAYREWRRDLGCDVLGLRTVSNQMIALSKTYACPYSGRRFRPGKSNTTGYWGLRLDL